MFSFVHINVLFFLFIKMPSGQKGKQQELRINQLEELLREHDLVVTGSKVELTARLLQANPGIVKSLPIGTEEVYARPLEDAAAESSISNLDT